MSSRRNPDSTIAAPGHGWWTAVTLPGSLPAEVGDVPEDTAVWLRCTVKLSRSLLASGPATLQIPASTTANAWLNGAPLTGTPAAGSELALPADAVLPDGINLLVLRLTPGESRMLLPAAAEIRCGQQTLSLAGRWQLQLDDGKDLSSIPLPAQFGIGSDVLFEPAPIVPGRRGGI